MRLRAIVRIRNDAMLSARKAKGLSQMKLAAQTGVSLQVICAYEKLDFRSPKDPDLFFEHVRKIATVLEIPIEDVAPERLRGKALRSQAEAVREISLPELEDTFARQKLLSAPVDELLMDAERSEAIAEVLAALSPRHRFVLEARFGMLGEPQMTYVEIADQLVMLKRKQGGTHRRLSTAGCRMLYHRALQEFLEIWNERGFGELYQGLELDRPVNVPAPHRERAPRAAFPIKALKSEVWMEMTIAIFKFHEIRPFVVALDAVEKGIGTLMKTAVRELGPMCFEEGRAGEIFMVTRAKVVSAMKMVLFESLGSENATARFNAETTPPSLLEEGWLRGKVLVKPGPLSGILPVIFKFEVRTRQTKISVGA